MSSSPDIIKDASDALRPISDRGITVMQGWYDKDIHDRHENIERACCHSGTVTQELSQETGRRTTFRPITGGQGTGKNQPHGKEAIHENDRTGTTHQNPASEKNVPDKGAKRET